MKGKTMKKLMALLMVIIMSASALVGCGGKDGDKDASKSGQVTLTIGIPKKANVTDYETNSLTLWLEEQTGYNLRFQYFSGAAADYSSQISTMVASGEKLPDIIWGMNLDDEAYTMYGEDGFLVDLAPYFEDEEKSAVFWDRFSQIYTDEFRYYCQSSLYDTEEGAIYGMPLIECSYFDTMSYQVFINQAWLTKLGLAMPTDTTSLYNVLKAFVTKDPNGNGQADEIGMIGTDAYTGSSGCINWITNMFLNETRNVWWTVDANGKVQFPYITDEYRQAMIYLNKLCTEGLIPESIFTFSESDLKGITNSGQSGENKAGIIVGHPTLLFADGNEALYDYVPMEHFGYAVENEGSFKKLTFISADCENVDAAWELLMVMCSEEGALRQRYGEKGVDWIEADEGSTSFVDKEARIKILNDAAWSEGNTLWHSIASTINIDAEQECRQVDKNDGTLSEWNLWKLDIMKQTYDNYQEALEAKPSTLVPKLIMTTEEEEATQVTRDNVKALVSSMRGKFICGTDGVDPNKDKDWNDYVNQIKSMGLAEWQEQTQGVYERQIKEYAEFDAE